MRALIRPGTSGAAGVTLMRQRLARLEVTDVGVISPSDPATELAAVAGALRGRTLLIDADLVAADACLGQLVGDATVGSGALVTHGVSTGRAGAVADPSLSVAVGATLPPPSPGRPGAGDGSHGAVGVATPPLGVATATAPEQAAPATTAPALGRATPVRSAHGRVASAGSAVHEVSDPDRVFLGALVVGAGDRDAAAKVLTAAADTARFAGWDGDPIDLALVALARGQVPMAAVASVGPVLRGGSDDERARVLGALESADEARLALEGARPPDDSPYSRVVLSRASRPVTALALRLRVPAAPISLLGLLVGLAAAGCLAWGAWPALLAGAALLQVSLIVGRAADEVGRFTRAWSAFGAWVGPVAPLVIEFAAYAGLAAGAARSGQDLWLVAAAVMAVQTVRHVAERAFGLVAGVRESWVPARPLLDTSDGPAGGSAEPRSRGGRRRAGRPWGRDLLHLPMAERWTVLGLAAVTIGQGAAFVLLLALGVVALAYALTEGIVRSLRWRDPPERSGRWLLTPQLDVGPIGEPLWTRTVARLDPLARSLGWLWPMAMRAVELGVVWWVVSHVAPEQAAWLVGWTFVVAVHHDDLLTRVRAGSTPPRWLSWFGLGWDGRTIVVLLAGFAGAGAVAGLVHVGVPLLALLFVVASSVQWIRFLGRRARRASHA